MRVVGGSCYLAERFKTDGSVDLSGGAFVVSGQVFDGVTCVVQFSEDVGGDSCICDDGFAKGVAGINADHFVSGVGCNGEDLGIKSHW